MTALDAESGALDESYGGNGSTSDEAFFVDGFAVDAEGRALYGRTRLDGGSATSGVRRLTVAGEPDGAFGTGGFAPVRARVSAVELTPAQNVLVGLAGFVGRLQGGPRPAFVGYVHLAPSLASSGEAALFVDADAEPSASIRYRGYAPFTPAPTGRDLAVRLRFPDGATPPVADEYALALPALEGATVYGASLIGIPPELLSRYAPNPDGADRSLRLDTEDLGIPPPLKTPEASGGVPVRVLHAATDAPDIDVRVRETGAVLATGVGFGESATSTLMPGTYTLELTPAGQPGVFLDARAFTVAEDAGELLVAATGFLNPSANEDGPPLALFAADASGETQEGVPTSEGTAPEASGALAVWPNPASGAARVTVTLAAPEAIRATVYDALGREVAVLHDGPLAAGAHALALDARALAPGVYVVRLRSAAGTATERLTVVR